MTVFKQIIDGELSADKVYEDEKTLAFLSIDPVYKGHTLVIPKTPVENIFDLPKDLEGPLLSSVNLVARAVKKAMGADGIKIVVNNGAAAGQEVFHLHFHVIPFFDKPSKKEGYKEGEASEISEKIKKEIS